MRAEKLSITLSPTLVHFIKEYQKSHDLHSKSEVIQEALRILRQKDLENEYLAANKEIDSTFDITVRDGLDDETW